MPKEARLRESVVATLKEVFSLYGFSPLETPAIEYASTLTEKYGEEADKLIYLFEDRGGREIGLRYDVTVPLARVVAQYQNELPIPFKRYHVAPVWRAEKPQAGRYREFLQADADIVGSASPLADAEVITCALACMDRLGFTDYTLYINDRKFLDGIGVTPQLAVIVDKKEKIGEEDVARELEKKVGSQKAEKILQSLKAAVEPESIKKIRQLVSALGGNTERVVFDPWLSRGLEYYTGPIFEIKVGKDSLSVFGGGRYDELIGRFAGRELPATGFSFGVDRVIEALEKENVLVPEKGTASPEALVTIFSPDFLLQSIKVAVALRNARVTTEVYPDEETKLDKQLKYADKRGVNWIVIVGPDEVKNDKITLRNMETGEQEELKLEQLVEKLS